MSEVKQQNKFGIVSRNNVSKIVGIQFSILSPEEILKGSVAEITSRDTYVNNKPVIGGLFDPRLGPLDPGMICPTDGLDYMQCPGYFGHIKLARPVFYIQYMSTIVKILKCVCIQCSKLLISKEAHRQFMKLSPDERWIQVSQLAMKVKRCGEDTEDGCGCLQPKKIHRKDGFAKLYAEWEKSVEGEETAAEESGDNNVVLKLTPEVVLKIFRRISDDDVEFMGFSPVFSRPDWMICQVLAVPPPAVRPSVKMEGSQRSEDDITHIIVSIIKANNTLQEKIRDGAATNIIDDWHMMLQYYVATQVNNNIPGVDAVAQRSGRPLKSITERLNGKGGRVRGNLMGKRVDFSARSVITPDPNLSIRELGVPLKIAKSITKPVVVNDRNKKFLTKLVRAGPEEYPGAKILERKTGESISLRYADRMNIALENGDVVHRHMMDGDAILFNRQPTLHRMSMMCHIVRVMYQGDTFRMNVGCTKPYNADFDGDEMNMHMPQDDESEIELRNLAAVPYQLVSPANNQPIIGIFQDSLIGSYLFTKEEIKFNPRHAMNIIAAYPKLNEALFKSGDDVSNFEILSQIIPPLSLKYKTKQFDEENDDFATSNKVLEVRAGKYKRGQIDKAVVGSGNTGLIQRVCNDYGNMAAADFIDGLQNVITEFMKTHAYSVGISDLIANKATNNQIAEQITKKKIDVKKIIDEVHLGIFENKTGRSNEAAFEDRISNILNSAVLEAGKIGLKSLNKNNRFVNLVKSGSKGNDFNISQMISCLGQQAIDGKRIPYGFENRTLPHFNKFDDTPLARGFIESSFISGLSPEEMFFHAQSGRIGLIDTAVKSVTWETPVVVVENNEPKYVKIGEWIDGHLSLNPTRIQHMEEQNMEYMELDNCVKIITMDYSGNISWESVTAITRHDPGEKLFKITTKGGRYVTVTANKSLLIWNEELGEFREKYTDEVKNGDFVPVSKLICDYPDVNTNLNEIKLDKYLHRSQFIYGNEVHKAINLMNIAMKNNKKIPKNWWNDNNNTSFVLPFNNKAKLQRAIVRSNICDISDNCVYPYNGTRKHSSIPDVFELNYENGLFIGLFMAEGNIYGSHIHITNNDETIRSFVKKWFSKFNISYGEMIKKNNANGTTTTIRGTSVIMALFITKLVGSGAENKHIPNEAYISNIEFVKGIISGYISGDGHVSKNSIESSSCCERMTQDIAYLCSRIGVFAKLFKSQLKQNNFGTKNIKPTYRLSIRAINGDIFAKQITLLHPEKNEKLKKIVWYTGFDKTTHLNDVILDEIVSIENVDPKNHPKMYDLTIPTTLNFGLANGLQVRDTSQTGYIQRRLIKGMEDIKVEYDMTVRNNKRRIVQFRYGDDGIDTIRVENQVLPLVSMSIEEIYAHFHMPMDATKDTTSAFTTSYTKETITRIKKQKNDLSVKTKEYINFMIEMRDLIIENVYENKDNKNVHLPVAFTHTINNIQGQQQINQNSMIDITPLETFEMIEAAYRQLENIYYAPPTELFKVMYYYYLSPKELLMIKRFNKSALTVLLEMIVYTYKKAIVAPGEMVGMVSAQSIGEPTTQLTLNTFHSSGVASKSNVTRGVPRIEELLSLSENPKNPSITIFLKEDDETNPERVQEYIPLIEHTKFAQIVESVEICFDPDNMNTLIQEDRNMMTQYNEFEKLIDECMAESSNEGGSGSGSGSVDQEKEKSKWIVRIKMDAAAMLDKKITMDDVHFAIKNSYNSEVSCVYSDYNSDNLIFRLRLHESMFGGDKKKTGKVNPLDQSDHIYVLKNFQDNLLNNLVLRGVKGIKKALIRKITDSVRKHEGSYVKRETWVLDTIGTNLMDILALDYIDPKRTFSNDIQEIYRVFGIEAARQAIFNELSEVLEHDGAHINYHHLALLCDRMTISSHMISIFRHGLNNDNTGPIAKASFEETPEMFLKAARHAELDPMRGISANVMCGQEGYYGTGIFQVMANLEEMMKQEDVDYEYTEGTDDIENAFGSDAGKANDKCSISKMSIQSCVDNVKKVNLGKVNDDYDMGF
jgi:DNA-directed RNA polymerase beta' subunit/intein/homing endonuclease